MILKYTNTLEDYIELQYFVNKVHPLIKLKIKFIKVFLYILYILWIYILFAVILSIYKDYSSTKLFILEALWILYNIIMFILMQILLKQEPKIYLKRLKKHYSRAIEKKPNLIKEKEVVLKSNKLIVNVDTSQTEILFDSIYKIFENNNKIYILNEKYKLLLLIPCDSFENTYDKQSFLNEIKK